MGELAYEVVEAVGFDEIDAEINAILNELG